MNEQDQIQGLIDRAKAGDRAAFDVVVRGYRERLENLLRSRMGVKLRGQVDPEDIRQEVLLRAFRSLEKFKWQGDDSFLKWLGGIAEHVILNQAFRGERIPKLQLEHDVVSHEPSPSKNLRRQDRFDRLQEALDSLGPEQREVILLARFQGCSLKEIARRLDKSPAAVGQIVSRAMRKLRESFGDTESLHLPDRNFEVGKDGSDAGE